MRKKFLIITMLLALCFGGFANSTSKPEGDPDEGMWLPMFFKQLNYGDMQKLGLKLTADQLYSINNSSLKDAIVQMGGGFCTAEMVSNNGLMFTNHHCGYDAIASQSTIEHDYLTNGFWSMSYEEEIPIPGLYVSFLVQMYDVTNDVLGEHTMDINKSQYAQEIQDKVDSLKSLYSENGKYRVTVQDFYDGNNYYMFVYQDFHDVRLVGAPPSSIGKFGGDTDNWMWPRHTGDFSIFRIYADKDNNPAEYSKDNVPYHPKHFLPVSLKGVESKDFAMIWGYPGTTERYMTSYEVENTINTINPSIDKAFGYMIPVMKKHMDEDNAVRLKYASDYASMMNMYKNKKGETRGLKRLHVYDKKLAIENRLENWIEDNASTKSKYKNVIKDLRSANRDVDSSFSNKYGWYHNLALYMSQRSMLALRTGITLQMAEKSGRLDTAMISKIKVNGDKHFSLYDQATEKDLFAALVNMECNAAHNDIVKRLVDGEGGVDKFVEKAFKKSVFANQENFDKFMKNPKSKKLDKDLIFQTTMCIYALLVGTENGNEKTESNFADARQNFVMALREMDPSLVRYPDANSTMRMTYGSVLDYYPADAIHYDYTTTIDGIMEKEDPTNEEFIVPQKLKDLYEMKDYGQYKDKNGNLTVCFLTNNDITGGNSGSPVINAEGQLIGLAFDGNWEAMSGDVAFEPELQRTICVDVRYVLFIIDKFAGCTRLIDELQIVK